MADTQQDKRPVWKNPVVIGLTTLAGVGVVTYFVRRSSTEDQGNGESEAGQLPSATQPTEPADTPTTPTGPQAPPPSAPEDVEFGEIQFPPDKTSPQWNHLKRLAQLAEEFTGITGLYSHLLAKADNESKGVMTAINAEGDGPSAFKLFCRDFNYNGRFKNNPWRPSECKRSDALASRWAYSGGWFGMMTATALGTRDKRGHNHDPARVFDPPFAVAYATDLVYRLRTGAGARNWGDIAGGWALLKWARHDNQGEGKQKVIERYNKNLRNQKSRGADVDLATKSVRTSSYPGFTATLHYLLQAEGRLGES